MIRGTESRLSLSFLVGKALLANIRVPDGTLLRVLTDWKKGERFSEEVGIPIAAGLIVGEAVVGVGFAFYYVIAGLM